MSASRDVAAQTAQSWQCLGPIAAGGTVFGLAVSPVENVPSYWAATGCGVFASEDGGKTWQQSLRGLSTPLLSALAVAHNGALFAGALGGDLFSSFDFGQTWKAGLVPQELKSTVTVVLASPRFSQDGVVFAATDGGGLLASRSSGNTYEESSFGLGEGTILALAASPDWSRNEIMFAATVDGVYLSRNGGRAWRETELMNPGDVVDVLAVSPAFERDRTVFAGTEEGRLYRSQDGGRRWDVLQERLGDGPLNCLWLADDFETSGRMVASVGAQVCVSVDGGESWHVAAQLPGTILALASGQGTLLAGLHDAGAYKSVDGGETWISLTEGLAARGLAALAPVGERLFAAGPQEGLWVRDGEGTPWVSLTGLHPYLPLSAQALTDPLTLLAASQEQGILRSADGGASWSVVCITPGVQALEFVPAAGLGWAGTGAGQLLATRDAGLTWQDEGTPMGGQEILAIAASPAFATDRTVLVGTAIPAVGVNAPRVALWRSQDAGKSWHQVTTQPTDARWLYIAMPIGVTEDVASQAVLATGSYCLRPLRRAKDVWISTRVDPRGANVLGALSVGELDRDGVLYAATGNGIYRSLDGGRTWQSFAEGLGDESFISIVADGTPEPQALYALSLGGLVWKRSLR